ncbi:hypothetical protein L3Q82_016739 [Scortum barcoo]|uniref:Uncharacterized protein n=1 Tax=Scortum barcoo TaxID=214431 RepID=A0ACB8X8E7_9TELE|nr:hypothetical protein L3Q82_016739 [Scortum barcoo]
MDQSPGSPAAQESAVPAASWLRVHSRGQREPAPAVCRPADGESA